MKEVYADEARSWSWTCPNEECDRENIVESNEINWRDTTPVVTCEGCKEEFEFKF